MIFLILKFQFFKEDLVSDSINSRIKNKRYWKKSAFRSRHQKFLKNTTVQFV